MSVVGRALAEPSRSVIVGRLLSGSAHTATELARAAGIGSSTVSEHLRILADAGLVVAEPSGRHRYFRLASPELAAWIEGLDELDLPSVSNPVVRRGDHRLADSRSCYDHLAGRLGVQLCDVMVAEATITTDGDTLQITEPGRRRLTDLGIELDSMNARRRPAVRTCLDWTERRHHLGGALGAALLAMFLEQGWLVRTSNDRRLLSITEVGRKQFDSKFSIQ